MGARFERFNARLVDFVKPMQFLLLLSATVLAVVGVWAVISWKVNDDKRQAIYDDLGEAARSIKTLSANAAAGTAEIQPTLKKFQETEVALNQFIVHKDQETEKLLTGLTSRLQTFDTLLVEARLQIRQNGNSFNKTIDESTNLVASLNKTITDVDTRVSKILEDGSLILETANPKLQALLDNANAVIVDADGTIKSFQPVGANLTGITADFNAMTTDSKNKLHEILYPAPVKGFWPNLKRAVGYVLTPALEGTRIYFQLKSLPVRITQPIPILKTP